MRLSEYLIQAKALIAIPEKWCQGLYHDPSTGKCCVAGAIMTACQDDFDRVHEGCNYLRKAIGVSTLSIWNDDPARTHEEVMLAFDGAIKLAQAEEAKNG